MEAACGGAAGQTGAADPRGGSADGGVAAMADAFVQPEVVAPAADDGSAPPPDASPAAPSSDAMPPGAGRDGAPDAIVEPPDDGPWPADQLPGDDRSRRADDRRPDRSAVV